MQNPRNSLVCIGAMLVALVCFSDTASAQDGTLVSTPPQLTFNAQTGTTPPSQTITITSTTGPTNVTVSAFSGNHWLSVTPTSGTTPLQLTVTVNPALSTLATDNGFLNISANSAFLSVRVELDINATGPSPLAAAPNSLSFTFAANSGVPVTKPIAISSGSAAVTSFTAVPITNDGGNWLTVNPTSGGLPGTIQVSVNPSALNGSGPFKAVVAINAPGTTGISVPVLVTLAGTPAVVVSPGQLNFAWQISTAAPVAQTLAITSSTGANVSFTATTKTTTCGNWLVISPQNGATPSSISAQVNTAGLTTAAQCAGEIDISAPGASNPTIAVPVNLLVSANPLLLVPSTGSTFTYQIGTSPQLAVQNVQIASSSTALSFTAAAAPTTVGGPSFLTVIPATGTTPQALALTVNPAVLATLGPGTYNETVTVTSAGAGNSPQTFPVTLTVNSNPILVPSVTSLTFNHEVGQTPPPSQTFLVSSTGAPLNFQISADTSSCSGFLSATGFSGANGLTYQDHGQVLVAVNVTGLTPQVCSGHITLTVPNSDSPAQVIPVTLNVSDQALLNVSTKSIDVIAVAGAAGTTKMISVTSTDATVLAFTATAATNPTGLTWLAVTPNSGSTPSNLVVTIDPQNLGVGTYSGTIKVASTSLPVQTIHVHLTIVSANVSPSLAQLKFAQTLGGNPPAAQTVNISGVPGGTTIGALATLFNGAGWLQTSVNGNAVTVTADGSALPQGTFSGVVTVIVPGAGNSPLYIPVTLSVSSVSANALMLSATTAAFTFEAGGVVPASKDIQVTSTTPGIAFNAAFTPDNGGNFVKVTPTSGTTPGTITLSIDGTLLTTIAKGTYTGKVVVSSPSLPGGDQTIMVSLTVSDAAAPAVNSVVNAASYLHGPISPGEIISIFGTNMGPTTGILFTPDNGHVDTTLGDVVVMFNNTAAPLIYVSDKQINAIVPYEIPANASISVTVKHGSSVSAEFSIASAATAPGIFSANQSGNGQGAILNSNLGPNSVTNPAPAGSVVSLYLTGEGLLNPQPATGSMSGPSLPLPVPLAHVSVKIGDEDADVSYAGEAPTLVSGVLQVNVKIPTDLHTGNKSVVVTIGNSDTKLQAITVAVQ